MGTSNFCLISLLQLLFICSVFARTKQSTLVSNSSSVPPAAIFALKTQKFGSGSGRGRRPAGASTVAAASELPFRHNVTLSVSLLVGTPPQPVTMVLDTGSELSWLHCKPDPKLKSVFDPTRSKSYSAVPCSSATCTEKTDGFPIPPSCDSKNLCHTMVSYADASYMEGTLSTESFKMAGSSQGSGLGKVVFGCMDHSTSDNEEDSKTTGLLGMNHGSLSFVTQMGYPKFAYCISGQDSSGVLVFGQANIPWLKPLSYTPLVKLDSPYRLPYFDRGAYSVQFQGVKVGGKILSLPKSVLQPDHVGAGQTMVDSGTQFTLLLGPVYKALRAEFSAQTRGKLKELGDPFYVFQGVMDLCYRVPLTQKGYPVLPTVTLMFKGAEMGISVDRLLYRVPGEVRGSDGVHCFTFGNSDLLGVSANIIGHHHQTNMWMEFDLANSRVGLASVQCAKASQRLGLGQ